MNIPTYHLSIPSFLPSGSIAFLLGPFSLNMIFSFAIIIRESKNDGPFGKWLNNHKEIAAVVTVLAGADVEMLKLLGSNLSGIGLRSVNAPFSKETENLILWGCVGCAFIEDLPQVVIQVCIQ